MPRINQTLPSTSLVPRTRTNNPPRTAPVRMSDIAAQAGVSRATVSFVLNQKHHAVGISEDTRLRVLQAAAQMGYRRNENARTMVTGRSRVFGLVVAQIESEVAGRILAGALEAADQHAHTVKVLSVEQAAGSTDALIARCAELRLAGVLTLYLSSPFLHALHGELEPYQIPLVTIDSSFPPAHGTRVMSDDDAGCRSLIDHLTGLGHRRIACVTGSGVSGAAARREAGFRTAMHERNLALPPEWVQPGDWAESEKTAQAIRTLFSSASPALRPTALVCADDKTALVALRTLRLLGLSVPGDVSVVGFADLQMARFSDPPLTTVAQPFREMGRAAVLSLLEGGAGGPLPDLLLPTRLVVRASTAAPARH